MSDDGITVTRWLRGYADFASAADAIDAERALADDLAAALDGYPSTSEHGEWDDDREAALARYRKARR